ncbi:hypothetical protein NUH16_003217 [Penicillium rubens]|nr:hypothetical protein NUH16_003217 [Penicillium rubens]
MRSSSVDSFSERPTKRRRHSSLPAEGQYDWPKLGRGWGREVEDVGKDKPIANAKSHSLAEELNQILQASPSLASTAIKLLNLYKQLWECYVMSSARKIYLEREHRVLRETNQWLAVENEQLRQFCNDHVLLLWDRQQAFQALRQGMVEALRSSERCQTSELQ